MVASLTEEIAVEPGNKEKLHILVVSGEPLILAELKKELMPHFNVCISASSQAAITAFDLYDIVAAIICTGGNNELALSVHSSISERLKNKNIPVIFLVVEDYITDEAASRYGDIDALITRINRKVVKESEAIKTEESAQDAESVDINTLLHGKTILVADDVKLNRDIVGYMLEGVEALRIVFAGDGKEAVARVEQFADVISLILMDVHMPVMSGLEATGIIREMSCDKAKNIPIIALTGSDDEGAIKECLDAGMNHFLPKPLSYDELIAVISKH
jgi:CheY-like chemotaxis protein